ncbi:MAG: hypothetical protein QXS70_06820, partial [Desulfurococcaceae archaeon]
VEVSNIKELYRMLRNYNGVFKYKNLLFFNSCQYGTFVYDIDVAKQDPSRYVEHLSVNCIEFKRFKSIIGKLAY